ncbi:MAG: riboflavin kinase / FMN adenylyltransferase [bacterium]|nr:MAG: riboflavin kinase / FMN adenylyltransferase [bacterium]
MSRPHDRPVGTGRSASVTIGVFDGVHRGHLALVNRVLEGAGRLRGESVVVTFDPHPAAVLAPEHVPPYLTTTAEKIARLRQAGVDRVVVIPFSVELAALTPEEFVDQHLVPRACPAELVIGPDFALGRDRVGDADRLGAIGRARDFKVDVVPARLDGDEVISSSRIRRLIQRGDMPAAARLLGRQPFLAGRVVAGDGRGRTIGVPTANLDVAAARCRPAAGVYAVRVRTGVDPAEIGYPGVMNVGTRPTFDGIGLRFEVHRLDWDGNARDAWWEVDLVDRLREERRFDGAAELAAQIREDIALSRQILSR